MLLLPNLLTIPSLTIDGIRFLGTSTFHHSGYEKMGMMKLCTNSLQMYIYLRGVAPMTFATVVYLKMVQKCIFCSQHFQKLVSDCVLQGKTILEAKEAIK